MQTSNVQTQKPVQTRFQNKAPQNGVTIFFDGACHLCSMEMNHYRKMNQDGVFRFIDIAKNDFKAEDHGLDPKKVQKEMHVIDQDGKLRVGVDAFIAIWDVLPKYRFLSRLARKSFVRPFLDVGYYSFAKIRPFLPKKNSLECESGSCER